MPISKKLNATVLGDGPVTVVLGNGLGTSQATWRHVVGAIAPLARIVRYDVAGAPNAAQGSFHAERYRTLFGHVDDVVALLDELALTDVIFVGHSVSGMIGLLAAVAAPERIGRLVTIGASPRYVDDLARGYVGGFSREAVEQLLVAAARDYPAWVASFSLAAIGDATREDHIGELAGSLLDMRPDVASSTLRAVLLSDHRDALPRVTQPVRVLQAHTDVAVPLAVGHFMHGNLADAELHVLDVAGHVPQLTAPDVIIAHLRAVIDAHLAVAVR